MARFTRLEPRLPVADVAASVEFYCNQLGFTTDLAPSEAENDFAIIGRDDLRIQLVTEDEHHPPGPFTIWIDTDDAVAEHAGLLGQVEIEWGPEIYDYGRREFAILDPDSHRIILSEAVDVG